MIQIPSLPEGTLGPEVLLLSVSRTSASSGGRVVAKPRSPSPPQAPARALPHHPQTTTSFLHHPRTTFSFPHHLPSPLKHHNPHTHLFLRRGPHLVLIPSWTFSDSTRIQNTPSTPINLHRIQ